MNREYVYIFEESLEIVTDLGGISSTLGLISYVFSALAIYTIAQRREIKKAWLAWVPLVNVWILGSISDQYRYVVKDQVKSRRKILLGVNIVNCLLCISLAVMLATTMFQALGYLMQGYDGMTIGNHLLKKALASLPLCIPLLIFSIVSVVFRAMALYDLYGSCEPESQVLYLVLSLIPGLNQITQPLFLFLCRNKDGGMPPRRETYQENPAEY